ncbi:MAG: hypothetical protein U1C58_03135 [Flavobacteriaceae bacterium]|nr:hypothetical protein [Flavobacteriaceae bacterium]
MKKVFLTAVAVVVFGSFSNNSNASNSIKNQSEFRDCMDAHFDAYIWVIEMGGTQESALMAGAIAFMGCTGVFY